MAVMGQSIQQCRGQFGVTEYIAPLRTGKPGGKPGEGEESLERERKAWTPTD
jgi:hypothetical protein